MIRVILANITRLKTYTCSQSPGQDEFIGTSLFDKRRNKELFKNARLKITRTQMVTNYCCIPQIVRFFVLFFDKTDNLWIFAE